MFHRHTDDNTLSPMLAQQYCARVRPMYIFVLRRLGSCVDRNKACSFIIVQWFPAPRPGKPWIWWVTKRDKVHINAAEGICSPVVLSRLTWWGGITYVLFINKSRSQLQGSSCIELHRPTLVKQPTYRKTRKMSSVGLLLGLSWIPSNMPTYTNPRWK